MPLVTYKCRENEKFHRHPDTFQDRVKAEDGTTRSFFAMSFSI